MPRTEVERTIAAVWQEVLRVEKVGVHDNFFDLGGHSLLMTRVYSKLGSVLKEKLSMVEMFQYPTVSALAKYVSEGQQEMPSLSAGESRAEIRTALMKRRNPFNRGRQATQE
jgi:acyl carrier protein